jgi:hypothetical protein
MPAFLLFQYNLPGPWSLIQPLRFTELELN